MYKVLDTQTLSEAKLQKWAQYTRQLPPTTRDSFQHLLRTAQEGHLADKEGEEDVTTSLLLSMIVTLKGEIEHLEDQLELEHIRHNTVN